MVGRDRGGERGDGVANAGRSDDLKSGAPRHDPPGEFVYVADATQPGPQTALGAKILSDGIALWFGGPPDADDEAERSEAVVRNVGDDEGLAACVDRQADLLGAAVAVAPVGHDLVQDAPQAEVDLGSGHGHRRSGDPNRLLAAQGLRSLAVCESAKMRLRFSIRTTACGHSPPSFKALTTF